jgi:hypothetical protein
MKSAMDLAPDRFLGKHAVDHSGNLRAVGGAGGGGAVEADLLFLPRGIERGQIVWIVGRRDLEGFAARPGKVRQDPHRRGIGRGLFLQPLGQGGEDHARLGQFLRRLRGRQDREVFEEQRQVIGQFVRRDFEPCAS